MCRGATARQDGTSSSLQLRGQRINPLYLEVELLQGKCQLGCKEGVPLVRMVVAGLGGQQGCQLHPPSPEVLRHVTATTNSVS
jgi:hypothetical protein